MKRKEFRKAGRQVSGTGIKIEVEIEVKHRRKDSDKAVRKDSRKGGGKAVRKDSRKGGGKAVRKDSRKGGGKDGRKDNRKTELEEGKGKGLKRRQKRRLKRGAGSAWAAALILALYLGNCSLKAFAATPEFAYTEEQWAGFRDDRLEFSEISDLIHVYNSTVIQNWLDYEEFKGEDADDIAQDYYDAADDISGSLEYPDSTDSNYASSLSSYLNSQIQADNLKEQGDDNVEDGEIKRLEYEKEEAQLVKEAQGEMISYWESLYEQENLEQKEIQAQSAYDSVLTQLSAGTAVQADLLTAEEGVTSAKAAILSGESGLKQTKEKLCLMLGWAYGSSVEMGQLPYPDGEQISAIQLQEDVSKGLEQNYELQILEKKIKNAKNQSNRSSLEEQLRSGKETVSSNIENAYATLKLALSNYQQAQESFVSESASMASADRKMAAGMMTKKDYVTQQTAFTAARTAVSTSQLELLKAQLDYQWAVDGLASAS